MPHIAITGSKISATSVHGELLTNQSGSQALIVKGKGVILHGMLVDMNDPAKGHFMATQGHLLVNGKAVCMVGDKTSLGGTILTGSDGLAV